jgi:hypothetical protein
MDKLNAFSTPRIALCGTRRSVNLDFVSCVVGSECSVATTDRTVAIGKGVKRPRDGYSDRAAMAGCTDHDVLRIA